MSFKNKFVCCVLGIAFIAGCGGQQLPDGMPRLYPVTITVTQDGVPLGDATVALVGTSQWTPTGATNAEGVATLYTQGRFRGAPEGNFRVTITKMLEEGQRPPPSPFDAESERIFQEYVRSGQTHRVFHVIPSAYRSADTTPLAVEIVRGTRNYTVNVEGTVREESVRER